MNEIKFLFVTWFNNKQAKVGILISLLLMVFFVYGQNNPPAQTIAESISSDELIPDGFSLVPIQLQNGEALQALIGSHALVNLYSAGVDGLTKSNLIGKKIKLIRSPKNPEQFSALVPSEDAVSLLSQSTPLFAVILSKQTDSSSEFRKKSKNSRIQIL